MKITRLSTTKDGKRLTQAALCDLMKMDNGTLSRWERGVTRPSESHMMVWAMSMGVDVSIALEKLRTTEGDGLVQIMTGDPGSPSSLITAFAALPEDQQRMALASIDPQTIERLARLFASAAKPSRITPPVEPNRAGNRSGVTPKPSD